MSARTGRLLLGTGSLVRVAYGLEAMLAPDAMSARRLEFSDRAATMLAWRDRGRADDVVRGSFGTASLGQATWSAAWRNL